MTDDEEIEMNDEKLSGGLPPNLSVGADPMPSTPAVAEPAEATPANEIAARAGEIASQTVEHAQRLGSAARTRLFRGADDRKQSLVRGLEGLAENMDELGERTGAEPDDLQRRAVDGAARAVRGLSRTLSERSTEELLEEAGRQIRRRPGVFLAGCVALGFIGARLLRR